MKVKNLFIKDRQHGFGFVIQIMNEKGTEAKTYLHIKSKFASLINIGDEFHLHIEGILNTPPWLKYCHDDKMIYDNPFVIYEKTFTEHGFYLWQNSRINNHNFLIFNPFKMSDTTQATQLESIPTEDVFKMKLTEFQNSKRALKLRERYRPKTLEEKYSTLYVVIFISSLICQIVSAITGGIFLFDKFLGALPAVPGAIIGALLLTGIVAGYWKSFCVLLPRNSIKIGFSLMIGIGENWG